MVLLDWLIVAAVFLALGGIAVFSSRYVKSVADFLSANRCAGRYLLVGAELMAMTSAAMFVARSEQYYNSGFPMIWWGNFLVLVMLVKGLSGWVLYRFRETRALTMAQFFEVRYSRNFRVFAGILAWVSGIINYAIHPAVTSRLLVYFCGWPTTLNLFGFEVQTIIVIMFIMLSVAAFLTLAGGQIALMVTDFFQGQFLLVVALVVAFFLFSQFEWSDIMGSLSMAPEGKSMLNPFDQTRVTGFNFWFFAMLAFFTFYHEMAFQGNQGYFGAAKSPHEAKMSRVIAMWRNVPLVLLYIVVAIIAYTILNGGSHLADAGAIQAKLSTIPEKWIQTQMRVPITFAHLLPAGLMGMVVAMFIASSLSTDDTYLHAWGSIFIQDVMLPLRKKERLSTKEHIKWLRLSVIFVAAFSLVAGSLIPFRDYVYMYFYITVSIYAAGAGSAIIGGLYWKRGTTAGAWSSVITGGVLSAFGFLLRIVWPKIPALAAFSEECPLNGMQMTFLACVIAILVYVVVSLLTSKEPFNLEQMLHRGEYAVEGEHRQVAEKVNIFRKLTGIDKEFTRRDKFYAFLALAWVVGWSAITWIGSAYGLAVKTTNEMWGKFWYALIIVYFVVGVTVFVWYLIGGLRDVRDLFRHLKTMQRVDQDDGAVSNHHNLADEGKIDD